MNSIESVLLVCFNYAESNIDKNTHVEKNGKIYPWQWLERQEWILETDKQLE